MKILTTPLSEEQIDELQIGDQLYLSGEIYCGRDAVLPKLAALWRDGKLAEYGVFLQGSVIFHTAVSIAGVGPTSSNKIEIEQSIAPLSQAGVKIHLGKGAISPQTVGALHQNNSVFAVIPPVTALLKSKTISLRVVAFPQEGMEALHLLEVDRYPIIIVAAKGRSIY